jgi:hypothetical protein
MADTMHRKPVKGEARHDLRFLHGIDLEGEHRRPPRFDRTRIILALAAALIIIAAVTAVLLTRGGTEIEEAPETPAAPAAPEAVDAVAIPQVTAPNRPAATDVIVPDLSGIAIAQTPQVRPQPDGRPAATDLIVLDLEGLEPQIENLSPGYRPAATDAIVLDTSGLPIVVPAAPGTVGEFLPD